MMVSYRNHQVEMKLIIHHLERTTIYYPTKNITCVILKSMVQCMGEEGGIDTYGL
jgi:hypothetical protein